MINFRSSHKIQRQLLNWDKPIPKFFRFIKWVFSGMPSANEQKYHEALVTLYTDSLYGNGEMRIEVRSFISKVLNE